MSLSALTVGLLFALGLALGSFGSVLVTRLPKSKSIGGRSQCPGCKKQIPATDLIPVISYLFLCGRCRSCKRKISLRYPLLELGSAIAITLPAFIEGYVDPFTVSYGVSLWFFLLLAVIDHDAQGIPDALTLPLIASAALTAYLRGGLSAVAPLIGGLFFFLQWFFSKGRIVGSGDILIGIAMGFLLGTWQGIAFGLGASYIIGAVIACGLLLTKKLTRKSRVAFVPYLFAGTVVVMVWGEWFVHVLR